MCDIYIRDHIMYPAWLTLRQLPPRIGHTQTGSEWLYTLFIFLNIAKYHD